MGEEPVIEGTIDVRDHYSDGNWNVEHVETLYLWSDGVVTWKRERA